MIRNPDTASPELRAGCELRAFQCRAIPRQVGQVRRIGVDVEDGVDVHTSLGSRSESIREALVPELRVDEHPDNPIFHSWRRVAAVIREREDAALDGHFEPLLSIVRHHGEDLQRHHASVTTSRESDKRECAGPGRQRQSRGAPAHEKGPRAIRGPDAEGASVAFGTRPTNRTLDSINDTPGERNQKSVMRFEKARPFTVGPGAEALTIENWWSIGAS